MLMKKKIKLLVSVVLVVVLSTIMSIGVLGADVESSDTTRAATYSCSGDLAYKRETSTVVNYYYYTNYRNGIVIDPHCDTHLCWVRYKQSNTLQGVCPYAISVRSIPSEILEDMR